MVSVVIYLIIPFLICITIFLVEVSDFLNEILDFEISIEETEAKQNDDYRVDLLGLDQNENRVIIENQYSFSNHKHLGQLLVYAITLDAKIAIWICEEVRQSHVEVIEWLNENSPIDMLFYLIEIKIGKVNDSYIPLFTIKVGPSDESRQIGKAKKDLSDNLKKKYEFWTGFLIEANKKTDLFKNNSPSTRHYISLSAGKGLSFNPVLTNKDIRTELYFYSNDMLTNKQYFDHLIQFKDEIEKNFGDALEWQRLDNKIPCRIKSVMKNISWEDEKNWPEIYNFFIERTIRLKNAFQKYIDKLL